MITSKKIDRARMIVQTVAPDLQDITDQSSLFLSGRLSSLQAIQMILAIEEVIGKSKALDVQSVSEIDSIDKIAAILTSLEISD